MAMSNDGYLYGSGIGFHPSGIVIGVFGPNPAFDFNPDDNSIHPVLT
jgi:hypothetical protein